MTNEQAVKRYLAEMNEKISELQQTLSQYPEGRLTVYEDRNYFKFRVTYDRSKGLSGRALKKEDRELIRTLIQKEWVLERLEELCGYREQLNRAEAGFSKKLHKVKEQAVIRNRAARDLFGMEPPGECGIRWAQEDFQTNPYKIEERKISVDGDWLVRSKSEQLIASGLLERGIPFRYECQLLLGNQTLYPDFMIRHPYTGKLYIWEHFGMMDHSSYRQDTLKKLERYWSFGYFPDDNLITTFEDRNHVLTLQHVEALIQEHFHDPVLNGSGLALLF